MKFLVGSSTKLKVSFERTTIKRFRLIKQVLVIVALGSD